MRPRSLAALAKHTATLARHTATLAVSASLLAACGGAAPEAMAPPAPPPQPSSAAAPALQSQGDKSLSAEGAVAAVDSAERAIDRALGVASQSTALAQSAGQTIAPLAPPPPPPEPPPPPAKGRPSPSREPASPKKATIEEAPRAAPAAETCGTACSALASMERAADHLCGITGATDDRCTGARTRVKNASARVHAACPACSQ